MDTDRLAAKEELLRQQPDFLTKAKKKVNGHQTYICPVCGNGSGKDGTGICLDISSKSIFPHWKCFNCGLYGDVVELWKKANNLTDDNEAFTTAYSHFGIIVDDMPVKALSKPVEPRKGKTGISIPPNSNGLKNGIKNTLNGIVENSTPEKPVKEEFQQTDYSNFFLQANKNLKLTDYHRGISLDTLNQFKVGFVQEWRHPKAPDSVPTSPRLIIPTSKNSYLARDTRENLSDIQKQYAKSKVGSVSVFNISALWNDEKPIFVVEGEIDAMSVCDVGGEAVGIGSTSMVNKLIETLETSEKKPSQPLILALDSDKAGQEATTKLSEGLDKLKIKYFVYNFTQSYKDANEFLINDRWGLADKVSAVNKNPEKAIYQENHSNSSFLQDFVNGITESVNTPFIPTMFKNFDNALDGGLYEGLYILGAISSLGKTTFALQICDNIAKNDNDVLIFSLEMSKFELMAKSISRLTLFDVLQSKGDTRNAKTARGITTGSRYVNYSQAEKDLIRRSIENYGKFADNIYIHEGVGDIGVSQVRKTIAEHIRITGRKPVVLVDYLQILAPSDVRASDKQNTDKAVIELKRISRDYKIPVIAISSFNRESYKSAVSFSSFKESGSVEYSSDVLIGLQLQGAGGKNFDVDAAKAKEPREVEAVVLKNRNGQTGQKIQLDYFPKFNYFEESQKKAQKERF